MVFSALFRPRSVVPDVDVAVPVIVRYASCPHCGRAYQIMVLASLREVVDPRPIVEGPGRAVINDAFRDTHLANPIRCPYCGREYVVFAGVEYSPSSHMVRNIHVRIARPEEPWVNEARRWPHAGLVKPNVIVFEPFQATIYNDLKHYEEYNDPADIHATSLPSDGGAQQPGGPFRVALPSTSSSDGGATHGQPVTVQLGMRMKRRPMLLFF